MVISTKKKQFFSSTIAGETYLQSPSIFEVVQEPELGTHLWIYRPTEPVYLEKPVKSFNDN